MGLHNVIYFRDGYKFPIDTNVHIEDHILKDYFIKTRKILKYSLQIISGLYIIIIPAKFICIPSPSKQIDKPL